MWNCSAILKTQVVWASRLALRRTVLATFTDLSIRRCNGYPVRQSEPSGFFGALRIRVVKISVRTETIAANRPGLVA